MHRLLTFCTTVVCLLAAPLGGDAIAGGGATASARGVEDPYAWLSARGVKDPSKQLSDPCCCSEVTVGGASEHALRCSDVAAGDEDAWIAVKEIITVVRAGKAVTVLEAWTALENLDLPPPVPPMLKLRLTIDRGGRTATIADPGSSSKVHCEDSAGRSTSLTADPRHSKWIERICASRGTYSWRGGRLVRAGR